MLKFHKYRIQHVTFDPNGTGLLYNPGFFYDCAHLIILYYRFVVMHNLLHLKPNIAHGKIKMHCMHIPISSLSF